MLTNVVKCPATNCQAIIVLAAHPKDKTEFNAADKTCTISCLECGGKFTVSLGEIALQEVSATWIHEKYPDFTERQSQGGK